MIRAEVEGVGTLEFPDGTDPAVIQATVKRVVAGRGNTGGVGPHSMGQGGTAGEKAGGTIRSALGEVMRGGVDVLGGGAQLLSRAANTAGFVPESNPGGFVAGPKDVEAQNAQARQNIEQFYKAGPEAPGFSPVRAASSALLTLPMTPTKFLQAPTAIGRASGAGVSGAVAGSLQEVRDPSSSGDFWARKGMQAGVGFGAGAAMQPLAEIAVKGVVGLINRGADKAAAIAKNLSGANSAEQLVGLTREALKKSGIDFDALDEAVKAGLLADVQKALASYSGVNPAAVARQAAFRQEKFDPLRHWVTKDPAEFTTLENLSHQTAGDVLKQRKADLDKHVLDRMLGMRGAQQTPSDVGTAATKDLKGFLGQEQGKTNVLYRTFQELAPDIKGNPQRFADDVFGGLEGKMAGAALPPSLREIVNKISAGEIPLTPSTLFQLQKMAKPGADGTANYALGHLRKAIDREMDALSKEIGGLDRSMPVVPGTKVPEKESAYAADVLKMARGQHAKVQGELEGSKILAAVDEGKAVPENFTASLLKAPVRELAGTWTKLGNDAKEAIRSEVIDHIKSKAFGAATDESGKAAAQASLMREINDPTTQQKLRIILGGKRLEEVNRLALMLESAHLQPAGSAVNNSKTGGALLSAFSRVADAAKAKGIYGSTALADTASKGLAQSAQFVPPTALGRQSLVIDPMVEEILKRRAGHGAGLLSAVSGYPALLGLLGGSQ